MTGNVFGATHHNVNNLPQRPLEDLLTPLSLQNKLDPKASYLAYGQRWDDRVSFRANYLYPSSADLRLCHVPYHDARHLAHVINALRHF